MGAESGQARSNNNHTSHDPRQAAEEFNRRYDQCRGAMDAAELRSYRVWYQQWDEAHRFEFLVLVAGHVATRLSREYPDGVSRAGRLMAEWFLR